MKKIYLFKKLSIILICFFFLISLIRNDKVYSTEILWHGFKGNSSHTGFVPTRLEKRLGVQWRYFFAGDYLSPLQIDSNNTYFIDRNNNFVSIKTKDSSENYKIKMVERRILSGSDMDTENVYFTFGPQFPERRRGEQGQMDLSCLMVAINKQTGEKIWEKKYNLYYAISPPLCENGNIYIAMGKIDATLSKTLGGKIASISKIDGEDISAVEMEEYSFVGNNLTAKGDIVLASAMKLNLSRSGNNVMIRATGAKLYAFKMNPGRILWELTPEENASLGSPAISGEYIYLMENMTRTGGGGGGGPQRVSESWMYKIDLKTGKTLQSYVFKNENFGNFTPTVANDAVYIMSFTGKIYCVENNLEKIYWTQTIGRFSFFTELTSTLNYLYTTTYEGDLLCISKEDGSIVFRYRIGKNGGIPTICGDSLMVSGENLYLFSPNVEPIVYIEPPSLDFGTLHPDEQKSLSFKVIYTGMDQIAGKVYVDNNFFSVKPGSLSSNIQIFFVTIDTKNLTGNNYQGNIIFESNRGNKTIPVSFTVKPIPPLDLIVELPVEGLLTNNKTLLIRGKTDPLIDITINNLIIRTNQEGNYNHNLTLKEGKNLVNIKATAKDGRKASLEREISLDTIPPELILHNNLPIYTSLNEVQITGKTEDEAIVTSSNGTVTQNPDGTFSITTSVTESVETVSITSKDKAGNETIKEVKIYLIDN